MNYIETCDWLMHFAAQRSYVLLDIKVLIFDLKIGPHLTLLGHNTLSLEIALLEKT